MFDNIFIISKGKKYIYVIDVYNERHTNKTERRNWVRMCYGVKSKCQLNCLIYGRVMLLIDVSIFYRCTLHASQIDWNIIGYGVTGDLWTPWGSPRVKTLPCILAIVKLTFLFTLLDPQIKCMRRTIEKRYDFMYETQERIK